MSLVINTNIASLIAGRNVGSTQGSLQSDISHLSSGLRITSAADDSAGLAISERLKSDATGYQQAARNANDGISAMQVAEGALSQVSNILNRMKELAVEASSSTNTTSIDNEFQQLQNEITRIKSATQFNGTALLDGTYSHSVQVGLGTTAGVDTIALNLSTINLTGTGSNALYVMGGASIDAPVASLGNTSPSVTVDSTASYSGASDKTYLFNVSGAGSMTGGAPGVGLAVQYSTDGGNTWTAVTPAAGKANLGNGVVVDMANGAYALGDSWTINAHAAVAGGPTGAASILGATKIDQDIATIAQDRGTIGALQNRLQYTVSNLQTMAQNTTASASQITDEDFATGMADFTKHQVLQQAGVAILAQANSLTQSVLKLVG